ncbi:TlpA disulfide reductase family protein [Alteribacillus sp. HJP-4]|uniref:TlpA disulfide reductase family protein n=1 Tax=Alteribacillus sp. HJP-4 TaxID=2775394 RepID=UPI0035CCFEAA
MNAPDFTLKEIESGKEWPLAAFKGKPLMITFWTSWCPDSAVDLQQKNTFYNSLDEARLQFLTINVTGREGAEPAAAKFLEENDYKFPVLQDDGTKVYDAYQCMGVPTTFLIDENLQIAERYNDRARFIDIMNGVQKLIS